MTSGIGERRSKLVRDSLKLVLAWITILVLAQIGRDFPLGADKGLLLFIVILGVVGTLALFTARTLLAWNVFLKDRKRLPPTDTSD